MTLDEDMKMRMARVKEALEDAKMHESFAFDRGLEQGRVEGEKAGLQETSRKLQEEGLDADFIKKITGLSPDEY